MNAREVITLVKIESSGMGDDADAFADHVLARLKAEGLFIGPLVATPEMKIVGGSIGIRAMSATIWDDMVQKWLRTEGA